MRSALICFRINPGIGQHDLDPGIHGLLIGIARAGLGKGDELAADAVREKVDLGAVIHQALGLGVDRMKMVDLVKGIDAALPIGGPIRTFVLHDVHRTDII